MGQSSFEDNQNDGIHSLREPLLDGVNKTFLDDGNADLSSGINDSSLTNVGSIGNRDGKATTSTTESSAPEQRRGDVVLLEHVSPRTFHVIGQWIWLYLVWDNVNMYYSVTYVTFDYESFIFIIVRCGVMAGHLFPLSRRLSLFPNTLDGRTQAQVNQETLPAMLSGLRIFCFDNTADAFLNTIAMSFILFELFGGSSGITALMSILCVPKKRILDELEVEYYNDPQNDDSVPKVDQVEAQSDALSKVERDPEVLDDENKEEPISSNIIDKQKTEWRWDWGVLGQWIWLFLVWNVFRYLMKAETLWLLAMLGHGIFLAMRNKKKKEKSQSNPSPLFTVNRENLPMVLSTFYIFSMNDMANDFLLILASWFILSQTARAAWRFVMNLLFRVFGKMEQEYFEHLKEQEYFDHLKKQEPEEAAKLERQMQQMAYLEDRNQSRPENQQTRKSMMLFALVICFTLIRFTIELYRNDEFFWLFEPIGEREPLVLKLSPPTLLRLSSNNHKDENGNSRSIDYYNYY